tara:strand:+ start:1011 stop:1163 length:153 start_codon:yes stop_codon:yes gene_type:complete
MSGTEKKEVTQLGVEFLRSRTLESVIRSHGKIVGRTEVEKQWKEAKKAKK